MTIRTTRPYVCGHCGEVFLTWKYHQIFCSRSCRSKGLWARKREAMLAVLVALDHYETLYGTIPKRITDTAANTLTSFKEAANAQATASMEKAKEELAELGYEENVNFTHVVGLPNLLENSGHISIGIHPIFGNKEYSKEDWNKAKGEYCKLHDINLHLDDTIEYEQYFKTPFARLWTKNK